MDSDITCSFCSKNRQMVEQMIAGPVFEQSIIYICNECVDFSYEVIHEDTSESEEVESNNSFDPAEIKAQLDEYVIGQDNAKVAISVAIYNHFKRINNKTDEIEIDKSNVLMIGPSGCGKTLLVKTLAKLFDIPYIIADATTLTEAGYVGNDVENLVELLLDKTDNDIEKAQHGIIFIDEIDKISRKGTSSTLNRDVSGEGVQQSLLTMAEGTVIKIQRKTSSGTIEFDTKDILFIASGAFIGINDIIKSSSNVSTIGINANIPNKNEDKNILHNVTSEDIISYGIIPEFIGRFPIVITFDEMTIELLVRVMTEPKNSLLSQFEYLFGIEGVELVFSDKYISEIAAISVRQKTGARGLRSIIEKTLQSTQYNLPTLANDELKSVVVNSVDDIKYVYNKLKKQVNDEKI